MLSSWLVTDNVLCRKWWIKTGFIHVASKTSQLYDSRKQFHYFNKFVRTKEIDIKDENVKHRETAATVELYPSSL